MGPFEFNPDGEATSWVGDEQDGCYVQTFRDDDGFYYTVVVDSESGGFVEELAMMVGPYGTRAEAKRDGEGLAIEWCLNNGVDWTEPEEDGGTT